MSEENFKQDIELLEYLSKKGQEALIESDKIEILDNNGNWVSTKTFGISQIPIIFSSEKIDDKNQSRIVYKLNYRLLIPNIIISPKKKEYIILEKDEREIFNKTYRTIPNEEYEEETKVRYNNENINTFSKAKKASAVITYITKTDKVLHEISTIIPKKNIKSKKLIKKYHNN